MVKLSGVTLIGDGNLLHYPWKQSIESMCLYCDEVLVNYNSNSTDDTLADLIALQFKYPQIRIFKKSWDMKNTGNGEELAKQINNILPEVKGNWIVYMQADEMLTENGGLYLIELLEKLNNNITQVELFRTYFWGDLQTRAPQYEIWLGRVFRSGTHEVGGDGMYLVRKSGEVTRSDIAIYHYSRMGTEKEITSRVRNLDKLFHDKEIVASFEDFTYNSLEEKDLVIYLGPHPKKILEFYK